MKKKWYFEKALPDTDHNYKIGFKVKREVFLKKSRYQEIRVLDTYGLGRILVLDGIVQLSEKYEFIYHEMLSHLPLISHPLPKKVLIIGGGDGGVLREVLKHPVKEVYLIELDKEIIDVSKRYLPFLDIKNSLKDKRVKLFFEDGNVFIKSNKNLFDIVIVDSTDPLGPSAVLFSKNFYQAAYNALAKKGIFITQSGNFIEQSAEIKNIYKKLKNLFPFVKIHRATVFDYELTDFSFALASKEKKLEKLNLKTIEKRFKNLRNYKGLRYYSPQIHFCSSVLPKFYKQELNLK